MFMDLTIYKIYSNKNKQILSITTFMVKVSWVKLQIFSAFIFLRNT